MTTRSVVANEVSLLHEKSAIMSAVSIPDLFSELTVEYSALMQAEIVKPIGNVTDKQWQVLLQFIHSLDDNQKQVFFRDIIPHIALDAAAIVLRYLDDYTAGKAEQSLQLFGVHPLSDAFFLYCEQNGNRVK